MSKLKILYGIQATGNGHLTRSKIIIDYLKNNYSDRIENIDICVSGNFSNLKNTIGARFIYDGMNLNFSSGKISLLKTVIKVDFFKSIIDSFRLDTKQYDIIISDFEPIVCWSGFFKGKRVLGIGNHYKFLSNKKFIENLDPKYFVNKIITKIVSPVSKYISFDYLKEDDNFFPIISETLRKLESNKGDYYIFYLSTLDVNDQVKFLGLFPKTNFIIYHHSIETEQKIDNIILKGISEETFYKDLVNCKGVVTHSGFQLTSECLYLGKKLGVIPINYQIEQIYNTKKLKSLGVVSMNWGDIQNFDDFFENDFFVRLNYIDELDNICKTIINHKS